jgi:hypothetical protein
MEDLQDIIAAQHGIVLHRKRVMKAFAAVHEGPLLDVLFSLTRPRTKPALRKKIETRHSRHHAVPTTPEIVRKGMVDYQRRPRPGV